MKITLQERAKKHNVCYSKNMDDEILTYIDRNPIAILGTLNPDGTPHGAVVYACLMDDRRHTIYFLTKTETAKYKNLRDRLHVSLTIVNPEENSTLQAGGTAHEVHDPQVIDAVMKKIVRAHTTAKEWLPPIAKLRAGAYVVVGIQVSRARLAYFKGMQIGDEHIFTES
jgi:general stress protein 26